MEVSEGRQQLRSWGVLIERDGKDFPSNAYAILTGCGGLHVAIQCGVFKGTTKEVFVDRREYTGPLREQIDEAFQFVLRNIHLGATIVGIYRQDVYEIPPDAIRELIINAVVHRSYLDHGTIQVAVYDNRLEITSPGKLPMGQTMERMKEGYSKIRNEALAHAFSYMNLIEHWGSGIPRIIGKVKKAGLQEPEFIGGEVELLSTFIEVKSMIPLTLIVTSMIPIVPKKCRIVPIKCRITLQKCRIVQMRCRIANRNDVFINMCWKMVP